MDKEELIQKYGIKIKSLEQEQIKLAKSLEIKDIIDFSEVQRIGAIENFIIRNNIISVMIVLDKDFEIIEQEYFLDKLRFPYLHGFKAYRELPAMTGVFAKIRDKPDIVLIKGAGVNHSRLGIVSHFSLATNTPSIGVGDKLFEGNEVKQDKVVMGEQVVGKVLESKQGSKPLFICPGNMVSVGTAYDLVEKMIQPPHKLPEPLYLAHKYAKSVKTELRID